MLAASGFTKRNAVKVQVVNSKQLEAEFVLMTNDMMAGKSAFKVYDLRTAPEALLGSPDFNAYRGVSSAGRWLMPSQLTLVVFLVRDPEQLVNITQLQQDAYRDCGYLGEPAYCVSYRVLVAGGQDEDAAMLNVSEITNSAALAGIFVRLVDLRGK